MNIIMMARNEQKLQAIGYNIEDAYNVKTRSLCADVRDRDEVNKAMEGLSGEWSSIDVLINNAGLGLGMDKIYEGNPAEWDDMIDTNVKGLLNVTRAVVPGMVNRKRGHIVNIGSIAGREVYPGGNIYCATKFAVKAITRALKIDLLGTPIRVSTIDPGMVETNFSVIRFRGDREKADAVYRGLKPLTGEDIAEAVIWVVSRPPHVDITEMVVLPTDQSTAILNHREED